MDSFRSHLHPFRVDLRYDRIWVAGEMVSVLWEQGNKTGALALERLWNELPNERAFHLHCAYPRAIFSQDDSGFANICDTHSHVLVGARL